MAGVNMPMMITQSFGELDEFGPGPWLWDGEPDKAQWVDEATGLDCLLVRGPMGALCGYVGVDRTHTAYGKDYDDMDVYVHGGLTFANRCDEANPHGICHIPLKGRPADIWWLGFDCSHGWDIIPRMLMHERDLPNYPKMPNLPWPDGRHSSYKNVAYVMGECKELAAQLAKL